MATDTTIRIKRNPYHGYEVWLLANGELTRRCFDNTIDLAAKLAADCVSDRDIEAACEQFERLEWEEPEYPLGVSWVGPQYDPNAWAFDDLSEPTCTCELCRLDSPLTFAHYVRAVFWMAAVAFPLVCLVLAGRWVWGVMS